eukprot:snap_masked-scaffold_26-processed-gene-0.15-mRNA-1 protein AED:0.02 eAED:0.02 QI:0/-1/0/1/-1/1/1/0/145
MSVIIPRSFKLLDELEKAEKGSGINYPHTGFISFGLTDPGDFDLRHWTASIIAPQGTSIADRFYTLTVITDKSYPDSPPQVWFRSKIVLPFVDKKNGKVNVTDNKIFGHWDRNESGIISVLVKIRESMKYANKYSQPNEGEEFKF